MWLWPLLHERAPGSPEKNCSLGMELGHAASLKHGAHKLGEALGTEELSLSPTRGPKWYSCFGILQRWVLNVFQTH